MADSRYNRLDNQAPVQTALKSDDVNVGRSAFDWSCIHNTNAIMGALVPIDCFDVVPNEDIDISLAALLEFRNPTTRQLFNGMRVFFHAYYNRLTDLWEGARNWLDNGRSGKISLNRPALIYNEINESSEIVNACTPMSLLNYLGLPSQVIPKTYDVDGSSVDVPPLRYFQSALYSDNIGDNNTADVIGASPTYFPADCAFAYQRNWRDYYCNKNLLQNNKFWFPDNEDHFILSYSCNEAVAVEYGYESFGDDDNNARYYNLVGYYPSNPRTSIDVTPEPNNPTTEKSVSYVDPVYAPNLSGLKFRQFRGDRFTTALPFPDLIRGDIPILNITESGLQGSFPVKYYIDGEDTQRGFYQRYVAGSTGIASATRLTSSPGSSSALTSDFKVNSKVDVDLTSVLSITMSDIYTLETLTAFRRRMGMTNGDYNEMIKAQYGVDPHVHDRKGTYIGGFYQDFAFSSVTQSSESGSTPLGTKAGQGVSSGSGSIGHFHTPDFGWIQVYMSIVPDVYYTQGIPKMFSKRNNLEMYFPIFNNLPAQAILNKELFVSGNTVVDQDVFAYEDRYAEYKSRQNRVSGLMALPVDKAPFDTARIIARRFESTPALNSLFVTMVPENVDMSVFTVSDEPPFDVSVGISCRRVFPGPYTAIEGSLSSPSLVRG